MFIYTTGNDSWKDAVFENKMLSVYSVALPNFSHFCGFEIFPVLHFTFAKGKIMHTAPKAENKNWG